MKTIIALLAFVLFSCICLAQDGLSPGERARREYLWKQKKAEIESNFSSPLSRYREFKKLFRNSSFGDKAKSEANRILTQQYYLVKDSGRCSRYKYFLDNFGSNTYRNEIKRLHSNCKDYEDKGVAKDCNTNKGEDKKAWKVATTANTISAYQNYISKCKKGEFVSDAERLVDSLNQADEDAWKNIIQSNKDETNPCAKIKNYDTYLSNKAHVKYREKAESKKSGLSKDCSMPTVSLTKSNDASGLLIYAVSGGKVDSDKAPYSYVLTRNNSSYNDASVNWLSTKNDKYQLTVDVLEGGKYALEIVDQLGQKASTKQVKLDQPDFKVETVGADNDQLLRIKGGAEPFNFSIPDIADGQLPEKRVINNIDEVLGDHVDKSGAYKLTITDANENEFILDEKVNIQKSGFELNMEYLLGISLAFLILIGIIFRKKLF